MKNRRLWILLGSLGLIGAVFLLLDFRLSASSNRTERFIVTIKLPAPQPGDEKIRMVVTGDGSLRRALQEALSEKMGEVGLSGLEVAREIDPGYQGPVLVVKVGRPAPLWTPIFAMSRTPVQAGYASDGDTAFMDIIAQTRTSTAKENAANLYAEFNLNDRSLGLISRPGYDRYLAEALAGEIVTALQEMYNG